MRIQQPGQGTEAAEERPRPDEEHNKDQRAAAETEVAACGAGMGRVPPPSRSSDMNTRATDVIIGVDVGTTAVKVVAGLRRQRGGCRAAKGTLRVSA